MSFDDQLKQAIERGKKRGDEHAREARAKALTEEELRRMHTQFRLHLSEHIEACLKRLPAHFPGFQFETVFGDRGWGAACKRDDLRLTRGTRASDYSRLEVTVRPHSPLNILEITGKGTVRNKEVFNRTYYELIADVDLEKFQQLVDAWVLEYAERYAAQDL
jgi:hypothetical protein